ncbi:MAG: TolC family protein [Verrucomicrobia bacterium]|jgi:outer membrane protein TolC|nr:TolC family protein [Verrucomicrobiota bacterium]
MKAVVQAILILTGLALANPAVRGEPATNVVPVTPTFIAQLAEEMRRNHPALLAAAARANAAAANAAAVRSWDDPSVRVGGMAAREAMRADEGDLIYGVEQKLPLFGKPALARAAAQSEFATEQANADYQFQTLRSDLAKTIFKTALAHRVVEIGQQDGEWLQTMVSATEARYRTDEATLAELLELQNELSKRTNQLRTDLALRGNEEFTLNRLLNRDPRSPWPALQLPAVAPAIAYSERLVDFSLKYEPKTLVMRQQVKQAEAAAKLTRRQRLPDFSAGLEARNYTGDGSFRQGMFVLNFNLPWGNGERYRNDIRREEAKQRAAELDLTDWQLSARQEVHHLTVAIDAVRREALLYRDEIIPRSEQALASARSAWETGRRTLREVLETRRMLLDARLMYARAVAEQYTMMSELVLCCGMGDFESLQMIGADIQPETAQPKN